MPVRIKYNRPELKRHRAALARYERYIPMLKLKQQQLQLALVGIVQRQAKLQEDLREARAAIATYEALFRDVSGLDLARLTRPADVEKEERNIAGVRVPELIDIRFEKPDYSLFATPPWVDAAIRDQRKVTRLELEVETVEEQFNRVARELRRIVQRVNLFEKVKVPEARDAIRRIRIHLGDAMAASVGRARIAKNRLEKRSEAP